MSRLRAVSLALVSGVLAAGAAVSTRTQTLAAAETTTIDFLAMSADGRPIPDLRPEDITIKIDGKTREIRGLTFVAVPANNSASVELPPQPFGTNVLAADANRSIVILIDDESIVAGRETPMREAIAQFLLSLAPADRVAVITVPHGGMKIDFTTDKARVRDVALQVGGQAPRTETATDAACRSRGTLVAIGGMLESLAGGDSPATVLFFSNSLMGPRAATTMSQRFDAAAGVSVNDNVGACALGPEDFQRVGLFAAAARARFYLIQPDPTPGGTGDPGATIRGSDNGQAGLENLAGITGAERLALLAPGEIALNRVTRETAGYYLAKLAPEPNDRNGVNHRVELKTSRDKIQVRTRPEFSFSKTTAPAHVAITPADMLKSPRLFRELPLRVSGYASRNLGDAKLRVIAVVEPTDPGVRLSSLATGLYDSAGRLVGQWSGGAAELTTLPVISALTAPAGRYRLRAAATDANGRTGSADCDVTVELAPAGSLKLSSVVLGLSRPTGFIPRLLFNREVVATAYVEIYGGQTGAQVSVSLEVATSLNGPPVLIQPVALSATGEADKFIATGAIPLAALPPADYVVRAVVAIQGQPSGVAVRTLRKSVQ